MKVGAPVLNLKLFSSNATFTFSNLAAFLNYSATAGAGFLLPFYLQVEKRYYGVASAIIGTMRFIGQTLSMSIVTLLFSIYVGKESLMQIAQPVLIKNMKVAFATFVGFCLLGVFTPLARGKVRK